MSNPENPYASPRAPAVELTEWVSRDTQAVRIVGYGLSCIYYGIFATVIAVVLAVVGAMLFQDPQQKAFVQVVALLIHVSGVICMAIGPVLFAWAPESSEARPWAYAAATSMGLSLLLGLIGAIFRLTGPMDVAMAMSLGGATALFSLLGVVSIQMFVRTMAIFVGRDDVAQIVIYWGIAMGCVIAGGASVLLGGTVALAGGILAFLAGVAAFMLYVRGISYLADSLSQASGPPPRPENEQPPQPAPPVDGANPYSQ